jgi:hypothetical protein
MGGWRLETLFADPHMKDREAVRTLPIGLCGGPLKRLQFYWTPALWALPFGSRSDSDTAAAGVELGVATIRNLQQSPSRV